tara:strand:+ start:870 stop:1391 length:522 start_codon:yes stop_codon:yes gene_type:complete
MAKKTKLPFSMMPGSWGLKGKSRAVAEAEYYYTGEELEKALAVINAETSADKTVAELKVDLKNKKISQSEFDRRVADENNEPWVNVNKMGIDPDSAKAGYIELDWNDPFIAFLHENGYTGQNDEDAVNKWFNDVCRTVLIQAERDLDYGLQEKQGTDDVIRSSKIDDGTKSKE